ncbi:MAG: DUF1214 domain-containing protein [Pseudomonadales bacterium]
MNKLSLVGLALLLVTVSFYTGRFTTPPPGAQGEDVKPELAALSTTKNWFQFMDVLQTAGNQVIRDGENGALNEQDAIERYLGLMTILSNTARMPLNNDPTRPLMTTFDLLPALSKIGGNSPDADYHGFPVSHEYSYRVRGTRGKAPFFALQVQSRDIDLVKMQPRMYLASVLTEDQLVYDEDGYFEVLVSKEKPEDYDGLWMAMDEKSMRMVIREYHHDRAAEGEPELSVEFLGEIPPARPLTDSQVSGLLQQATFMSKFWFEARDWYPELREPDAVNHFQTSEQGTVERSQDLALAADVQYMLGWWSLEEDEALVIEGVAPESPYWIIQLADRWLETTDFRRRQVHLNNSQVKIGADGNYRIVIAAKDPGIPNWLDNGERTEGLMSFRWAYAQDVVPPQTRVFKVSDL